MRGVVATSRARKSVPELWAEASDPKAWPRLVEAFAGYGLKFQGEVVAGPREPAGMGTEVALGRLRRPASMRCRVAWWDPPRGLTLTAQTGGWFNAYHATFTLRVGEINEDLSSLELSMKVIFMNRFVELASLLLPAGFLYRRRLANILSAIAG